MLSRVRRIKIGALRAHHRQDDGFVVCVHLACQRLSIRFSSVFMVLGVRRVGAVTQQVSDHPHQTTRAADQIMEVLVI